MLQIIEPHLQGRKILFLFLITNLIYVAMLLVTIPVVKTYAGGMELLDMMPGGYDSNYVYQLLKTLGKDGRDAYLYRQIPLDLLYPGLFGITYCLIIGWFLKQIGKLNAPWTWLCWFPVIGGAFDYFENFGVITLLTSYPDRSDLLAGVTSFFSVTKAVASSLGMTAVVVLAIAFLIRKLTNRQRITK